MRRKMVRKGGPEMIKEREETTKELENMLNDRMDEANSLMIRNQLVIEMM